MMMYDDDSDVLQDEECACENMCDVERSCVVVVVRFEEIEVERLGNKSESLL